MTNYEKRVREELRRLVDLKTAGAAEALSRIDPDDVMEQMRQGASVAQCVVNLMVPANA